MKGLIDHYIVSVYKVEKQLRKDSDKKAKLFYGELNFEEETDENIDYAIREVLKNLD